MTRKHLFLLCSHISVFVAGGMLGIYLLPIIIAPGAPERNELIAFADNAVYSASLDKGLKGSDWLHWADGQVYISPGAIAFLGKLAPGPDYKLYLTPKLVTDKKDFLSIKNHSVMIGDIRTFDNFIVSVPASVDIHQYPALLIWCEAFNQFISAGLYRPELQK